jgi:DNA-binding NtrC family response regulator
MLSKRFLASSLGTPVAATIGSVVLRRTFPMTSPKPMTETEKARVLLVDDEEGVRMSLQALLDREYRISSVASGEAAMDELPRFRPDLVLLDVRLLPSMSGLDVLERIKAFDERIEVVMITAFASLSTLNEALRRGAFGYLIKPFPRRDLALMVRDALARRGLRPDPA